MSQYFPKPHEPFYGDLNVKVDLSNYVKKIDIKNISHIDTSIFALKSNQLVYKLNLINQIKILNSLPNNLSNSKNKVDKLYINNLAPVPVELSKLIKNNVVKNEAAKRPSIMPRSRILKIKQVILLT